MLDQSLGQDHHVLRRRYLIFVVQTRRILKTRVFHAQFPGNSGHFVRELFFGSRQSLCHDDGRIVRRFRYHRKNRIFNRYRRARLQPHAGSRLTCGFS